MGKIYKFLTFFICLKIRVPLKKLMLNIPFFSYIPQQTIDQLISVSQETMMERDAPITRVNKLSFDLIKIITKAR